MDRFLHIFKSLALAPIGLDRLRPWMWSSEEESEENILFNFGQFMLVLHLEADVKLPHDSLVVIAVHYTGSHADIQVILEFLWLPHCHYTKALIIPPSTFKVKKFLSKLWTWRWSSVLKATSIVTGDGVSFRILFTWKLVFPFGFYVLLVQTLNCWEFSMH